MFTTTRYGDLAHLTSAQQAPLEKILLTGATGFVGSHFLLWRLRAGAEQHLLLRAADVAEAELRVQRALGVCAASYSAPLDVRTSAGASRIALGDVTLPSCGLDYADIAALRAAGITQVWHCAASLEFQGRYRDEILTTNVEGVANVLDLTERIGAKHFVHVSSAYSAGTRSGTISEQLHGDDTQFNNCYEQSKHLSELKVAELCSERGLAYSILRPSVIVGPSDSHRSGGSRFGIYGFVGGLHKSRNLLRRLTTPLRLVGDADAALDFVPIDQVVYDMLWLAHHGLDDRRVYHLTNGAELNLKQALAHIDELVGLEQSLQFVSDGETKPSALQTTFDRRTEFYRGYYASKLSFARSLPNHRPLSFGDFRSYIATFLAELTSGGDGFELERHAKRPLSVRGEATELRSSIRAVGPYVRALLG